MIGRDPSQRKKCRLSHEHVRPLLHPGSLVLASFSGAKGADSLAYVLVLSAIVPACCPWWDLCFLGGGASVIAAYSTRWTDVLTVL